MTVEQIRNRTKTVTRRTGFADIKAGEIVRAVRKSMGLKKGERQEVLAYLVVTDVRTEPLIDITGEDVGREGFVDMPQTDFVDLFCRMAGVNNPWMKVRRIEFRYIPGGRVSPLP